MGTGIEGEADQKESAQPLNLLLETLFPRPVAEEVMGRGAKEK